MWISQNGEVWANKEYDISDLLIANILDKYERTDQSISDYYGK